MAIDERYLLPREKPWLGSADAADPNLSRDPAPLRTSEQKGPLARARILLTVNIGQTLRQLRERLRGSTSR